MRYIRTKDLKIGMVVARAIYNEKNSSIINKDTTIRDIHLKSLIKNNYKGAYIKDDLTNDVIVENPIPEKLKNEAVLSLQELVVAITELGKSKLDGDGEAFIGKREEIVNNKIDIVINVAKKIAKDIYYNNEVNFDLFDLQGEGYDVIANSIATTELSVLVGRNLNYNLSDCEDLAVSALLNDIGKYAEDEFVMGAINFSQNIINNLKITGEIQPYNDDYHSLYSYLILSGNRRLSVEIRNTILLHNEREDMEGPLRRKPYSDNSKIISIADVYVEVIAGVRGQKFACPKEARAKIMTYHGSKFDKTFLEAFLMYISPYPKGTSVLLSNGLEGIIKENNKGMLIDRPVVILVPPINNDKRKIYQQCIANETKLNIGHFLSTLDKSLYQKYFTEDDTVLLEKYLRSGNQELYDQVFITKDKNILIKFYATCDRAILERLFTSPKKSIIDLSKNINNYIVIDDSLILDEPETKKNFNI